MKNKNISISASECKKHLLKLIEEIKTKNYSFVITKRKVPIAKIIPLENESIKKETFFGYMKGTAKIKSDIVNTNFENDWDLNND